MHLKVKQPYDTNRVERTMEKQNSKVLLIIVLNSFIIGFVLASTIST
jgi:hypothetical protein